MSRVLRGAMLPFLLLLASAPPGGAAPAANPPRSQVQVTMVHWLSHRAHVSWREVAGATSYDVRVAHTSARAGGPAPWTYPRGLQHRTGTRVKIPIDAGTVLCASVRVHTRGRTGPWSPRRCVAKAFPVAMLTRSGPVTQLDDRRMWGHHALVTRHTATVSLLEVPDGATVGVLVTHPAGNRGFLLRTGSRQVAVGYASAEDPLQRNVAILVPRPTVRPTRLTFSKARTTSASFPLQALYVRPRWVG